MLVSTQQVAHGRSLLSLVLRQMEVIKFASDWKKIGQQRGGKKYKGAFARSVYEARTGLPPPMECETVTLDSGSGKNYAGDCSCYFSHWDTVHGK